MLQYICIVTNENESPKHDFVNSISFHTSYEDAESYGYEVMDTLSGESDFFVYRNLTQKEDEILYLNSENDLPF